MSVHHILNINVKVFNPLSSTGEFTNRRETTIFGIVLSAEYLLWALRHLLHEPDYTRLWGCVLHSSF
jgi:hypothetical protein